MEEIRRIELSVRELVEFVGRKGDIDVRFSRSDPDAMQEGARLHRKIQKEQGSGYKAEVTLSREIFEEYDGEHMLIAIEGRADGIFEAMLSDVAGKQGQSALIVKNFLDKEKENGSSDREIWFIDEIKTTYRDVDIMTEPVEVHLSQAKCYACIYAKDNDLDIVGVRMNYCNLENEHKKFFYYIYLQEELSSWLKAMTHEYSKWMAWQIKWERKRNAAIRKLEFPFSYREGQKDLVIGVYRTISRKKKLFLEAPTGVGKTISTVFPAVKAMGEGLTSKLFYGTAKTIARTVAEEAFSIIKDAGVLMKTVTITAKEKICILEKPACNPDECPRAKGHFDRVNDCVYDMLCSEEGITREKIISYAEKHNVCPFEMCLDVTTWADAVICDYNYLFDPNVYLRRFFADGPERDYVFLIDEAHNLVERAREMYSAVIVKEEFLLVKKMVGSSDYLHKKLSGAIDKCNRQMLDLKRQCEDFAVWEDVDSLFGSLLAFMGVYESLPVSFRVEDQEMLSKLYLDVRHFVNMYQSMEDNYSIYSDYSEEGCFRLTLRCMDPSKPLKQCIKRGRSAVFFSATLIPVKYYISQLGGNEEDYAVYAPSPFSKEKRLIAVARDVSSKYTRRGPGEYEKIAEYIKTFVSAHQGNYMVFFPSYRMMNDICSVLEEMYGDEINIAENFEPDNADETKEKNGICFIKQKPGMTETEKESFLESFDGANTGTHVGCCVMGGIFGEGIDLRADRLIGAVIVGTGLPQVCYERELFRNYFDEKNGNGFEYAYLYNGMNKVLQSAGRVIRTADDKGAILLLDERFGTTQYQNLFPQEWYPFNYVNRQSLKSLLDGFWGE